MSRRATVAVAAVAGWVALACGGPTVAGFCEAVHSLDLADAAALTADSTDRAEVRAQLQRVATKTNDVVAAAPADIEPHVEVLAGVVNDLYEAVVNTEGQDQLVQAAALVDAQSPWLERLPESTDRYVAYVTRNCTPEP